MRASDGDTSTRSPEQQHTSVRASDGSTSSRSIEQQRQDPPSSNVTVSTQWSPQKIISPSAKFSSIVVAIDHTYCLPAPNVLKIKLDNVCDLANETSKKRKLMQQTIRRQKKKMANLRLE